MVKALGVGYIAVKRCVILVTVHHVLFLSLKDAAVGQLLGQWSVTKHRQKLRSSLVIDLVGKRRTVEGTAAVSDVALFLIQKIPSQVVGILIFVQCRVRRSLDVGSTLASHFVTVVTALPALRQFSRI